MHIDDTYHDVNRNAHNNMVLVDVTQQHGPPIIRPFKVRKDVEQLNDRLVFFMADANIKAGLILEVFA